MHLDRLDRRVLRAVQADCTQSAEQLSAVCGASASTILRRLQRLRREGVIVAEVAYVDPRKTGRPLSMIVGIRLDRDDARIAADFVRRMRDNSAVTQCYFVTGSADYVLHISARDMGEYNAFVQAELIGNPSVSMTETNVVISPIKVGLAVPIDD